jgi:S-DNA-T family DNA segregation ATPase FtsK/SpoIIIE
MSDSTTSKTIEDLEKEIVGLKSRMKRVENFIELITVVEEKYSDDELVDEATKILKGRKYASATLLQRKLSIGYVRAARLMDHLEEKGLVSLPDGSNLQKVLINTKELENDK